MEKNKGTAVNSHKGHYTASSYIMIKQLFIRILPKVDSYIYCKSICKLQHRFKFQLKSHWLIFNFWICVVYVWPVATQNTKYQLPGAPVNKREPYLTPVIILSSICDSLWCYADMNKTISAIPSFCTLHINTEITFIMKFTFQLHEVLHSTKFQHRENLALAVSGRLVIVELCSHMHIMMLNLTC